MPKFLERLRGLLRDRRKERKPVDKDRRGGGSGGRQKEADDRLHNALDNLDRTVRLHRDDFKAIAVASNDRQQVVIFSTFREICRFTGPDVGKVRLCRHSGHPDAANTQLAICEERKCPVLSAALKGVA